MADPVLFAFTVLAAVSAIVAVGAFVDAIRFGIRLRREAARSWPAYTPRVVVIVACKGVDPGLHGNLAALLDQDYPDYRVVFALDDYEDEAHEVIRKVAGTAVHQIAVVAADPVPSATGKAAALIRAAKELTPGDEVVAFMDSDAHPPRHWLRDLVGPLQHATVGATTAYRWYTHDASLPSATRAAWNAAGTNIMFQDRWNFAWGGSSALRREAFERTYVAAKWGSALSDDMVVTQAVKGAGLRITYVPRATVLTQEPCEWRSLVEWTTRQTIMMRAYDPRVTRYAALAYATVAGSVDLGVALGLVAVIADPGYWLPAALFLSHLPLLAVRSAMRLRGYRRIVSRSTGPMGSFILGGIVVPWLTLYVLSIARKVRVISWRGTVYELRGPAPIRVVRR